ncbi:MAG: DNA repair protein RadA [Candidatus Gracilibacteria bacterium]|jgi:DNA repair protein RadA/Sms|nr:DNA repair protein RadA [Candidatus Gracilibacteria bacterium]
MLKEKTKYTCKECGAESPKWVGKCPSCEAWNSFEQETISITPRKLSTKISPKSPQKLNFVKSDFTRYETKISEFDRVLGGGIVPSTLILFSGEPGIGKSTLTLQIAGKIAKSHKVLMFSGEESLEQIANRAQRLNINEENLLALSEYNLETIIETMKTEKPKLTIIDSIQVISSLDIQANSGSITQIKYCTERLLETAKTANSAIIIIGHVTKDGNLAGPRVLEHLVDTVISLEGDRFQQFRLLRSSKNRFGSCNEVGIFEMNEKGLKEIKNPSEQFLEGRKKNAHGSAITVAMEGNRPFTVEVQALTTTSNFGFPKRTATGFDLNRLQILIAILEKHAKLNLQNQDVFVNVVGGIKLKEPASDLAVASAITSSLLKKPISNETVIFGEMGLSGELRKIPHLDKRIKEAEKMGFSKILSPEKHKEILSALSDL